MYWSQRHDVANTIEYLAKRPQHSLQTMTYAIDTNNNIHFADVPIHPFNLVRHVRSNRMMVDGAGTITVDGKSLRHEPYQNAGLGVPYIADKIGD